MGQATISWMGGLITLLSINLPLLSLIAWAACLFASIRMKRSYTDDQQQRYRRNRRVCMILAGLFTLLTIAFYILIFIFSVIWRLSRCRKRPLPEQLPHAAASSRKRLDFTAFGRNYDLS